MSGFCLWASIHISWKVGFHAEFYLSALPHLHVFCSPFNACNPFWPRNLSFIFFLLPFSPHPSLMLCFSLTRWELSSWIHLWAVPSSSWYSPAQYGACMAAFPRLRGGSFQGKDWASTFLSWALWQTGERKPGCSKSWEDDPSWQSFDVVVYWHKDTIECWILASADWDHWAAS